MSAVTMQELELETAELLPSRETLNSCCNCCGCEVEFECEFEISCG